MFLGSLLKNECNICHPAIWFLRPAVQVLSKAVKCKPSREKAAIIFQLRLNPDKMFDKDFCPDSDKHNTAGNLHPVF
jgi:hypothetical protein